MLSKATLVSCAGMLLRALRMGLLVRGRCGAAGITLCVMAGLVIATALAPTQAAAQVPRLELNPGTGAVDAWSGITVLPDPSGTLDVAGAQRQRPNFQVPRTPHANLGVQPGAVWLHMTLVAAPSEETRWIMHIDSAMLEFVDIHLISEGAVVRHFALSSNTPFTQRQFPIRAHGVVLDLEPGRPYEVLMRVQATKMIVPISFYTPTAFLNSEAREQMVQGTIAGLVLCLLLYSMAQWVVLRDTVFLTYSLYVGGIAMLFYAYFGVGSEHLWRDSAWMAEHVPVLGALVGNAGIAAFSLQALAIRQWNQRVSQAMTGILASIVLTGLLYALDWISLHVAGAVASITAPLLVVMAMAAAVRRLRAGDRAAPYMLCGWAIYNCGLVGFVGMYQGFLPANYWTQHALQFFSLGEVSMWMLALGVRMEEIRSSAKRAHLEQESLHSMAHTDALTGLLNRRGLNHVVNESLLCVAPNRITAMYLLDLDGFKPINDRLGHDAGDELLVGVARRLKQLVRARDTVARIGGDEFVVVATQLPNDTEARRLGQKLLDGMRAPFDVAGQSCHVGLTVGYALGPLDGTDATTLLKRADEAMYAGKQAGRHCIRRSGEAQAAGEGFAGVTQDPATTLVRALDRG